MTCFVLYICLINYFTNLKYVFNHIHPHSSQIHTLFLPIQFCIHLFLTYKDQFVLLKYYSVCDHQLELWLTCKELHVREKVFSLPSAFTNFQNSSLLGIGSWGQLQSPCSICCDWPCISFVHDAINTVSSLYVAVPLCLEDNFLDITHN